jgi:ATP/maltotriose-dependent transcriptional regulator MalT
MCGQFAAAAAFAAAGEAAAERIGSRWDAHVARFLRAKAQLYAGDLAGAEAIIRDLIASAKGEEVYIVAAAQHDGGILRALRGDHRGALTDFTRALHAFQELGELWNAAASLEGAATAALGLDRAGSAAYLLGAAAAMRAWLHTPVLIPDQPAYERTIAAARDILGEAAFAEAWAAGEAATLDEAVACTTELATAAATERDVQASGKRTFGTRLTPREREVLTLLVAGQSDPQIGVTLSISARTVESHVAAILAKLAQPSRTAAVAHAVRHNLV